jgi:hypothetical protein
VRRLVLALLAGLALLAAGCGGTETRPLPKGRALSASWSLSPAAALFGEPVQARVDMLLDREQLDPGGISFQPDFTPFEVVGEPSVSREDLGGFTRLRYEWTLRCITLGCIKLVNGGPQEIPPGGIPPPSTGQGGFGERKTVRIKAVPIQYEDDSGKTRVLRRVIWPDVQSISRLNLADTSVTGFGFPFRASATPLPEATFRISPWLLGPLLVAVAGALLAFAAIVLWRVLRRKPAPVVEDAGPELTPLERALQLVEWSCEQPNGTERRKALEVLAGELGADGRPDLVDEARGLAWSATTPSPEAAGQLAYRVREGDGPAV